MQAMPRASIYAASLTAFAAFAIAQTHPAIPPSEKNFFIGTPAGWVQPKTPWGDPDLQGIYPLNYVGSVPLQRCNGPARPGAPPCDPHKEFLTADEYKKLVENSTDRREVQFAAAAKDGEAGRAFIAGVTDPTTPQRQTSDVLRSRSAAAAIELQISQAVEATKAFEVHIGIAIPRLSLVAIVQPFTAAPRPFLREFGEPGNDACIFLRFCARLNA